MKIVHFCLVIITLIFCSHALALDCDGTCPARPLSGPGSAGSHKYALIAYDGINVYEAPYKNSRSTKHNFKQLVYIYKENKDLLLIGKSDNGKELLGWIENRHLLMDKKPLEHMHVFKKLLPMNSFEEGNLSQRIPFRAGPGSNYRVVHESAIFAIWYVYREENGYSLVGKGQTWNADISIGDAPVIAGWVDNKSCYAWNTRLALNFKKESIHGREKAKFFRSAKAAQSYYNTQRYNDDDVIKEESNVPLKYWEMRFPMINTIFVEQRKIPLSYVGIPGNIILEGRESTVPPSEFTEREQKIIALRNDSQNIDILFVIDNTTSMGPAFRETRLAVETFIKQIATTYKERTKFALATYRDYDEGQKVFKMRTNFNEASGGVVDPLIRELQQAERECRDVHDKTYPEAVYNGLAESLNSAKWRTGSSRFVILIGDHGDHPRRDRNGWTDEGGMPSQNLIDLLTKNSVSLYYLHIRRGDNNAEKMRAENAFREQATYLISKYKLPAFYFDFAESDGNLKNNIVGIARGDFIPSVRGIVDFLDCLRKPAKDRSSQDVCIGKINTSSFFSVKNRGAVNFTDKVLELIQSKIIAKKMSIEQIKQLGGVLQVASVGWCFKNNQKHQEQFQYELLVEKNILSIFKGILASVVVFSERAPQTLANALNIAAQQATGQKIEKGQNIREYFTAVLGIDLQDSLLNRTEAELTELCSRTPDECIKLLDKIKRSKIYLDSVEGRYELEETSNGKIEFVYEDKERKKKKEKEYWWQTETGEEFAWVPYNYFP